ncbi:uncharacterized protein LOC119385289 [Rhipicephalus sanguineus]|uniref:uncharacterized protein LOC119385289 n=1 Tax=Rhipicephalus sanguineus TaxID=34632 RepID=UPI0018937295|nr:uncharacterized protein LOC119385289 [Rhipicephalus sanguineus]
MAATRAPTDGPSRAAQTHVKLPKLELQRFSGASTEWQSFWEQFERAVHENDTLSDSEKFLYLRSSLSGKAASAIDGIQVTGANYNTAIELLKERFGRRDVLIQEHLTQLLELPSVRNENEVIGLRRLYNHLQRNIAALAALGVKTDGYGALLCSALLRLLPSELVVNYHKGLSADSKEEGIGIESLRAFLKTEVESREKALQTTGQVIGEEDITIYPFGGAGNIIKEKRRRVKLWLRSQYDRNDHFIEALEIPEICSDQLRVPENIMQELQAEIDELADVTVAPAHLARSGIDILIGADYYWSLVYGVFKKLQGTLVALKTKFGWTLQGAIPCSSSAACCSTAAVLRAGVSEDTTSLTNELKSFW